MIWQISYVSLVCGVTISVFFATAQLVVSALLDDNENNVVINDHSGKNDAVYAI